jgi:hypothetical protein
MNLAVASPLTIMIGAKRVATTIDIRNPFLWYSSRRPLSMAKA